MNKKNLSILVLYFITFASCKNEIKKQFTYYKSGNISNEIIKINQNKVYITHYDNLGNIESKGVILNEKENGWWTIYKNEKINKKIEFITFENKAYANQEITYDANGKIIDSLSDYFVFKIPDTIKKGKTKIKSYYNKYFTPKSDVFICIGYDINKDFSNLSKVRIDTFYVENPKKGWFGLRYETVGKKTIRGFIYEKNFEIIDNLKNKDSSSLILNEHKKFFEKEVYVRE